MIDLTEWLQTATKPSLLSFVARAIHSLTIRSRSFYSEPDGLGGMVECNEAIHHLVGHLIGLAKPAREVDYGRIENVASDIRLLSHEEIDRLKNVC